MNQKQRNKLYMDIENDYPREHFNENKTPKVGFHTMASARNYLITGDKLDIYDYYYCPICGKYHIGHKRL